MPGELGRRAGLRFEGRLEMRCEGSCDKSSPRGHQGDPKIVRVTGGSTFITSRDWGKFVYCDEAIRIDRANGFVVTEIQESPTND